MWLNAKTPKVIWFIWLPEPRNIGWALKCPLSASLTINNTCIKTISTQFLLSLRVFIVSTEVGQQCMIIYSRKACFTTVYSAFVQFQICCPSKNKPRWGFSTNKRRLVRPHSTDPHKEAWLTYMWTMCSIKFVVMFVWNMLKGILHSFPRV